MSEEYESIDGVPVVPLDAIRDFVTRLEWQAEEHEGQVAGAYLDDAATNLRQLLAQLARSEAQLLAVMRDVAATAERDIERARRLESAEAECEALRRERDDVRAAWDHGVAGLTKASHAQVALVTSRLHATEQERDAAIARAEAAEAELERWRNCFFCIECGRGAVDEDGCCTTCGRDCIHVVDGKLADTGVSDHIDAIERRMTNAEAELARVREERDELRKAYRAEHHGLLSDAVKQTVEAIHWEARAATIERDTAEAIAAFVAHIRETVAEKFSSAVVRDCAVALCQRIETDIRAGQWRKEQK